MTRLYIGLLVQTHFVEVFCIIKLYNEWTQLKLKWNFIIKDLMNNLFSVILLKMKLYLLKMI